MDVLLFLVAILAVVWIRQFAFLMSLEDDTFYGKHDRMLWVGAFVVIPFLTPFAFLLWRRVRTNGQDGACSALEPSRGTGDKHPRGRMRRCLAVALITIGHAATTLWLCLWYSSLTFYRGSRAGGVTWVEQMLRRVVSLLLTPLSPPVPFLAGGVWYSLPLFLLNSLIWALTLVFLWHVFWGQGGCDGVPGGRGDLKRPSP